MRKIVGAGGTGSIQTRCGFGPGKIMGYAVINAEPSAFLACWLGVGKLLPQTNPCAEGGLHMNWDQIESKWAAMTRRVGGEFSVTKGMSKDKSPCDNWLRDTGAADTGAAKIDAVGGDARDKRAGVGGDLMAKAGPVKRPMMSTQ